MSPLVGLWNLLLPCKWFERWLLSCFFNAGFHGDAALLCKRRGAAQAAGCSKSLFGQAGHALTLRRDTRGLFNQARSPAPEWAQAKRMK